jgi:hypothetical protein
MLKRGYTAGYENGEANKIARLTDWRLRRRYTAVGYVVVLPIRDMTWVDFETRINDRICAELHNDFVKNLMGGHTDSHAWIQR